jgi:hypothetical protein
LQARKGRGPPQIFYFKLVCIHKLSTSILYIYFYNRIIDIYKFHAYLGGQVAILVTCRSRVCVHARVRACMCGKKISRPTRPQPLGLAPSLSISTIST